MGKLVVIINHPNYSEEELAHAVAAMKDRLQAEIVHACEEKRKSKSRILREYAEKMGLNFVDIPLSDSCDLAKMLGDIAFHVNEKREAKWKK